MKCYEGQCSPYDIMVHATVSEKKLYKLTCRKTFSSHKTALRCNVCTILTTNVLISRLSQTFLPCAVCMQGAIAGMIGGVWLTLWIYIGSAVHNTSPTTLPVGACKGNRTIVFPLPNPNA